MHANEFGISAGLVQQLIDSQFPEYADHALTKVDSAGTDNAIYRLGDTMCVRLPRIEDAAAKIEKEYECLPRLGPLPLAIPEPLHLGSPSPEYPWPWSIYSWIKGKTIDPEMVTDLTGTTVLLADVINTLQKRATRNGPLFGAHNNFRGAPLSRLDSSTRDAIGALGSLIDQAAVTEVWNTPLTAPEWNNAPVWVHGDIHAGNLMAHQDRIGAVIDFGLLGVGDPACDLMIAWTLLSTESRDAFQTAINVDDATWTRGRGWALFFALVALAYYLETNPFLVQMSRRTITEVLSDR